MFYLERLKYFIDENDDFSQFELFIDTIEKFHSTIHHTRRIPPVNEEEIFHYFGVLIYLGFNRSTNVEQEYKRDTVLKYHSLTHRRFKEIGRCIRFDSLYERDQNDPLAPVRSLIDHVNLKMKEFYQPSNRFTLDEHIIPFTGRFSSLVFIKDKPHSRGLRVDCLNDCVTGFLYKFIIYAKQKKEMEEETNIEFVQLENDDITVEMTQRDDPATSIVLNTQIDEYDIPQSMPIDEQKENIKKPKQPKQLKAKKKTKKEKISKTNKYNYQYSMSDGMVLTTVKNMLHEFENPINNDILKDIPQPMDEETTKIINEQHRPKVLVGMDNYYTTKSVIDYLIEKNIGFVGTVRINRPYMSDTFKNLKLDLHGSKQVTKENVTLVNYRAKTQKNVFVMSNQIDAFRRCKGSKEKPEIILLYNSVKGATDRFDHLISNYDIRRKANRFQLAVLYDILNITVTNIFILKRMDNIDLDHEIFGYELSMHLLGETIGIKRPTICCTTMETTLNSKVHNTFLIVRVDHPKGKIVEQGTTKQICLQCGKPIEPHTVKRIMLKYCSTCYNSLGYTSCD